MLLYPHRPSKKKKRDRSLKALAPGYSPAPPPPPPPPPPAAVTVVWTMKAGEQHVDFAFSEPVTTDGGGSEAVVVHMVDGPYDAVASTQIADNVVRFEFSGSALAAGNPWEILSVPACLDLHGATLVVPQSGEVG